jgi:hypothetical protein
MATLLISSWVIASTALCLSLLIAAARPCPRIGQSGVSEPLDSCAEAAPVLAHVAAAPETPWVALS